MRISTIPAQITTLEDKIAGNLNLTQIILLVLSLFDAVMIYAIFPQRLHLTYYKIPVIIFSSSILLILAFRIKGKVVIEWLLILIKYNLRPRYYLYDKSCLYLRDVIIEPPQPKLQKAPEVKKKIAEKVDQAISFADRVRIEQILANPRYQFSMRFGKEGNINAVVSEVKK